MAHVEFIGKGRVDGQEYNQGNTLDVDEATKSRLLKEGCIKNDGENGDCSELQTELDTANKSLEVRDQQISELSEALKNANEKLEVPADFDNLLTDLENAKTIAEYKAVTDKYTKDD